MAFCSKCKGEMPTTAIECPHCGYDFSESHVAEPDPAETDIHAAGIRLDRLMDEFTNIGKFQDGIESLAQLAFRNAVEQPTQVDILFTGEIGIETGTQLKQCSDTPISIHRALGRIQSATNHLQQRRLARSVATNNAYGLAAPHFKRDVTQGPKFLEVRVSPYTGQSTDPWKDHLLESIGRLRINIVFLAERLNGNG